ncbi:hypothetical protein [Nocardia terpenica]|uniref:Uncharacterized protein n=1 Tax=Nocardia terpenica TaxID=455432 RepID=A0A164JXX0_9NOCA|nr:hypothetical protein [Nocardia terpenica]KZM70832.1 hypothetical protein AWN90_40500 [Nocardia terpenica]MBF6060148.1 hypothetical protein [Nocardia terpenica]MBF6103408.1 hypothetical protein [Nocardia terpenica]MBF6112218.1 hypothetical protein [Nocardia terpenica]MBF6117629.1 hypothetical protein [Nocardia terpenica]
MRRRLWLGIDAVLAVLCLVAAVRSWHAGIGTTFFAADGDQPAFEATRYIGPWLALAALLVVVAGLALIDLVVRWARRE